MLEFQYSSTHGLSLSANHISPFGKSWVQIKALAPGPDGIPHPRPISSSFTLFCATSLGKYASYRRPNVCTATLSELGFEFAAIWLNERKSLYDCAAPESEDIGQLMIVAGFVQRSAATTPAAAAAAMARARSSRLLSTILRAVESDSSVADIQTCAECGG